MITTKKDKLTILKRIYELSLSIKRLFEGYFRMSDEVHCYPTQKQINKMAEDLKYLDFSIDTLADKPYPENGSDEHKKDLRSVKDCFIRPINNKNFLVRSNEKPFTLFTEYQEDFELDIDMDMLDKLNDDLSNIVMQLKFKYNRPRPKVYMERINSEFPHEDIKYNKSPSYPSGHTAHAYFNCTIMSHLCPEHSVRLRSLADMIAQSRIDLGRHYPTDVAYGKFIGELVANCFIQGKKSTQSKRNKKSEKNNRMKLIDAAKRHKQQDRGTSYLDELSEFITTSNLIERYTTDIKEVYKASKSFLNGLPVEYCTDCNFIKSHLNAIDKSLNYNSLTPKIIQEIHKGLGIEVLERGQPGQFRDFDHFSRSGYHFSMPENVLSDLNMFCQTDYDDAFTKHVAYESIHPFCDGNGRSGRIILLKDLDYDFYSCNDLINNDYIARIIKIQNN